MVTDMQCQGPPPATTLSAVLRILDYPCEAALSADCSKDDLIAHIECMRYDETPMKVAYHSCLTFGDSALDSRMLPQGGEMHNTPKASYFAEWVLTQKNVNPSSLTDHSLALPRSGQPWPWPACARTVGISLSCDLGTKVGFLA